MANMTRDQFGIVIWTAQHFGRQVAIGAFDEARRLGLPPMRLVDAREVQRARLAGGRSSELTGLDGLVAPLTPNEWRVELAECGFPVVGVTRLSGDFGPWVTAVVAVDAEACGKMAGEHLASRRLRHAAVVNSRPYLASVEALVRGLRAGLGCGEDDAAEVPVFTGGAGTPRTERAKFRRFLKGLPRPCGLVATSVQGAHWAQEEAERIGMRIPADLATLTTDNDVIRCHQSRPTISAVAMPAREFGRRAVGLLARITGRVTSPAGTGTTDPVSKSVLLLPREVVARESTETVACDDAVVLAAVRFIRERFQHPISVLDVAKHVGLSERALCYRFKHHLGLGVHKELTRVRIERARQLLAGTDQLVKTVAYNCGWSNPNHFNRFFRQHVGMSPMAYREAHGTQGQATEEDGLGGR